MQQSSVDQPADSILSSDTIPIYGLYQNKKDERSQMFNRAMKHAYENPIEKYLNSGLVSNPSKHYSRLSLSDLAAAIPAQSTERSTDSRHSPSLLGDVDHEKNFKVHF